jgi:hypothetical protein
MHIAANPLKEIGRTLKEIGRTLKEIGRTLKEIGRTLKEIGRTLKEIGRTLKEIGKTPEEYSHTHKQIGVRLVQPTKGAFDWSRLAQLSRWSDGCSSVVPPVEVRTVQVCVLGITPYRSQPCQPAALIMQCTTSANTLQ